MISVSTVLSNETISDIKNEKKKLKIITAIHVLVSKV